MEKSARIKRNVSLHGFPLSKIAACLAISAFMVMMLVKPGYYLDSARRGLSLYATSVLPSLFPFYFFSLLLTYIGSAKVVSGIFQKPVRALYNTPKESSYILLLSMLSGYPVGASMTAELYTAGVLSQKEAKAVAAFASTSGPIFILGTVGSAIFDDVRIGAVILTAHYISALLNGLIFRVRKNGDSHSDRGDLNFEKYPPIRISSAEDQDSLMSRTIANSTLNMLFVGGYIVLCGMLVDTFALFNVDTMIISALGESAGQPVVALINGLIEMTRGSLACAECSQKNIGIALCAAIISLGGLSVTLQNYTFLSKCKMSFAQIVIRKLSQSILAFVLGFALSYAV